MNNELKYWLAFSKLEGVGSANLFDIYSHFGSMEAAWIASALDWQEVKQLRNSTISAFKAKQKEIYTRFAIINCIIEIKYLHGSFPQQCNILQKM